MQLDRLTVLGLRGFSAGAALEFARPNGQAGSGLTILVGPNSGGKSTVLESLRAGVSGRVVSFSQGQRNEAGGDSVQITWLQDGQEGSLTSVRPGSSETVRTGRRLTNTYYVPSRRVFAPYFGQNALGRSAMETQQFIPQFRGQNFDQFSGRMIHMDREQSQDAFNALLEEVAGAPVDWSIDQQDGGNYFIKIRSDGGAHSSDGMGEGSLSLMVVADALHDSSPGDVIVIDEPELSLHPGHQRRLRAVLSRYAADRQIILATHSPYFVDWADLAAGGVIVRIHKRDGSCRISTPDRSAITALTGSAADLHNPHTLGIHASEVFFLDDNVLVVEGQEDVLVYRALAEALGVDLVGDFFGWGSGGADKMPHIVRLLKGLGFQHVVGILDGDRVALAEQMRADFPEFLFEVIPTEDVRTKVARSMPARQGLTDPQGMLIQEHRLAVEALFSAIASYFIG